MKCLTREQLQTLWRRLLNPDTAAVPCCAVRAVHYASFAPQLLAAVAEAEREVAELRQLREEEDVLLLSAVQAMGGLWQQLQDVRRLQGGRALTNVAFSVVQLPPAHGDEAPLQAVRLFGCFANQLSSCF